MEDLNVRFNDTSSREIFYLAREGTFIPERRKMFFLGGKVMSSDLLDDKNFDGGIIRKKDEHIGEASLFLRVPAEEIGFSTSRSSRK